MSITYGRSCHKVGFFITRSICIDRVIKAPLCNCVLWSFQLNITLHYLAFPICIFINRVGLYCNWYWLWYTIEIIFFVFPHMFIYTSIIYQTHLWLDNCVLSSDFPIYTAIHQIRSKLFDDFVLYHWFSQSSHGKLPVWLHDSLW